MENSLIGRVHSIESMGLVDGPGVRSVVFLQGCALRCKYCHNPDTWQTNGAKLNLTPKELVEKLVRFKNYYADNGGVTFSGGEPLLQIDFVIEAFKLLKKHGIHTCLDTAGVGDFTQHDYIDKLVKLFEVTDLVLLDIKHYDGVQYKQITNRNIDCFNKFLEVLQKTDIPIWIRHVVVPTLTDDVEHIKLLKQYVSIIKNVEKIELLPYHTMGINKYEKLGIPYPLNNILPPSNENMEEYKKIIEIKED